MTQQERVARCVAAIREKTGFAPRTALILGSGLGALAFMHFGIGRDMATVLIKAILFSLLSVFTLMPGLLMVFSKKIDATRHRKLIPRITALGRFDVATRFVIPPVFAVVVVIAAVLANQCPYCYSFTDLVTAAKAIVTDTDARYAAFAKAEASMLNNALCIPCLFEVFWCLTHVNEYTKINAMFGPCNLKYVNWETSEEAYTTVQYEQFAKAFDLASQG